MSKCLVNFNIMKACFDMRFCHSSYAKYYTSARIDRGDGRVRRTGANIAGWGRPFAGPHVEWDNPVMKLPFDMKTALKDGHDLVFTLHSEQVRADEYVGDVRVSMRLISLLEGVEMVEDFPIYDGSGVEIGSLWVHFFPITLDHEAGEDPESALASALWQSSGDEQAEYAQGGQARGRGGLQYNAGRGSDGEYGGGGYNSKNQDQSALASALRKGGQARGGGGGRHSGIGGRGSHGDYSGSSGTGGFAAGRHQYNAGVDAAQGSHVEHSGGGYDKYNQDESALASTLWQSSGDEQAEYAQGGQARGRGGLQYNAGVYAGRGQAPGGGGGRHSAIGGRGIHGDYSGSSGTGGFAAGRHQYNAGVYPGQGSHVEYSGNVGFAAGAQQYNAGVYAGVGSHGEHSGGGYDSGRYNQFGHLGGMSSAGDGTNYGLSGENGYVAHGANRPNTTQFGGRGMGRGSFAREVGVRVVANTIFSAGEKLLDNVNSYFGGGFTSSTTSTVTEDAGY